MSAPDLPRRPRAVLFDMDGTITRPLLDYPRIRAEMGIGDAPILESLPTMTPGRRQQAMQVLLRHEREAAEKSTLNAGCAELLSWLAEAAIRTALITRNSPLSVRTVLGLHGLRFDVVYTREDGTMKPDPHGLHLACRRLGVSTDQAWMVGDGSHDVAAGLAAGIRTVWISHGRDPDFAERPWRTVPGLCELADLLRSCASPTEVNLQAPNVSDGKPL